MSGLAQRINHSIEYFFERIGFGIAHFPVVFLTLSICIGLLSLGLMTAEEEKDLYNLWVDDDSPVHKERDFNDRYYGALDSRVDTLLVVDKNNPGQDMATLRHFQELLVVSYDMAYSVSTTVDGVTYDYFDVCDRYLAPPTFVAGGLDELVCNRFHPLDCFKEGSFDLDIPIPDSRVNRPSLVDVAAASDPDAEVKRIIKAGLDDHVGCTTAIGVEGPINFRFGGVEYTADDEIASIPSLQIVFNLKGPVRVAQDLCDCDVPDAATEALAERIVLTWESAYMNAMEQINDADLLEHTFLTYFTQRSVDDLVSEAGAADSGLIVLGYIVMAIYASLSMFRLNLVHSRVLVGISGIVLVAISVAAGMGLTALAGIKFAPTTTQVLPFLALGLGVDDMFVLAHSYYLKGFDTVEAASADCMRRAGSSITLTSVVNCIAFAIGSSIPLPAVSEFSAAASLAVLTNYFIVLFGFLAILTIDARRQFAGRKDILFCIKDPNVEKPSASGDHTHPSPVGDFVGGLVTKGPVKIAILIIFFGFFGFTCFGVTEAEIGLPLPDIVPEDSFADHWLTYREKYYGDWNSALVVGYDADTGELANHDFSSANNQKNLLALEEELSTVYKMNADLPITSFSWLRDMISFAQSDTPLLTIPQEDRLTDGVINPTHFYTIFNAFMDSDDALTLGGSFVLERSASGSITNVLASSQTMLHKDLFGTDDYVKVIKETRDIIDASPVPCYPSGVVYQLYEQYVRVNDYLVSHLIYVGVAILGISFFFLFHPAATIIMVVVITMIIVEVYGLLAFAGLKVNGVTAVNLVMAVGVSVEFTAHIVRSFMINTGTRNERVIGAMREMTIPVVNGAVSTFLGFCFMAGASFPYFQLYFFNMYAIIIAVGFFNGICLLPVLLSLIGPGSLTPDGAQGSKVSPAVEMS